MPRERLQVTYRENDGEATVEGRKRKNLGRFVLRGKAQPVGSLTKQLSRQGREREQATYRENGCR